MVGTRTDWPLSGPDVRGWEIFMPPLTLLIKPASGSCNLRCKYCFYADESEKRSCAHFGCMSQETMRVLADKALAYADRDCTFAFQGGEPTLAGLDFFRGITAYLGAHPNPKRVRIHYAFQTNGILLDEAWAKWFAENHVLVGISLDGPKQIHDQYRVDQAGKGTFHRVMGAIRLLKKYGVEYNILTVVTAASARNSQQVYHFFKKNGMPYQQYIECLDPLDEVPGRHAYSLTPERYETFLKNLFDAWYLDLQAGTYVYNRYFENLLLMMNGQCAESCNLRGSCNPQWVFEADGSVYPCDFYVLDEWRLGNILEDSFQDLEKRKRRREFAASSEKIPEECMECRWFALCRNGCRRNRKGGEGHSSGKNYFCASYRNFLEYAYPRLLEIYRMRSVGWRCC